jgi:hypothetical protein
VEPLSALCLPFLYGRRPVLGAVRYATMDSSFSSLRCACWGWCSRLSRADMLLAICGLLLVSASWVAIESFSPGGNVPD